MRHYLLLGSLLLGACGSHPDSVVDAETSQQRAFVERPLLPFAEGLCKPVKRGLSRPGEGEESPCGKDVTGSDPGIRAVDFEHRPESGFAGRTVHPSGRVDGAHFSGDPQAPMVTEETGCVSADCVRTLWNLAAGLYAEQKLGVVPTANTSVGTFITVQADGVPGRIAFPLLPPAKSARAEQIAKHIGVMYIGYW
jgi:hypothetical protein